MQVTPLVGGPSADSFEGEANKFAQNHVVTLPSKQCDNCYLRCGAVGWNHCIGVIDTEYTIIHPKLNLDIKIFVFLPSM